MNKLVGKLLGTSFFAGCALLVVAAIGALIMAFFTSPREFIAACAVIGSIGAIVGGVVWMVLFCGDDE